jgi:MoxR-like ATPase
MRLTGPPKTQAAMLQTMQEREEHRFEDLPFAPFHVFATQNPIEMEGTYVLPEAQPTGSCSASIVGISTITEEERVV